MIVVFLDRCKATVRNYAYTTKIVFPLTFLHFVCASVKSIPPVLCIYVISWWLTLILFVTEQVSRLLAVMHVISSTSELFSLASSNTILADSHWASYFHQASIGTQLNNQFFPNTTGRSCVQDLNFAQVY